MAVEGSRLQAGGPLLRLGLQKALNPGASHQQGAHLHPLPDTQSPGALGTQQALVAGETHHVDTLGIHVNGEGPRRLGGVQDEQQIVFPGKAPHPLQIRHVSRQVGSVGADHRPGIGPQKSLQCAIIQLPTAVRREKIQPHPPLPQAVQGAENGVVLPVRGDHMVPRPQQAADGNVQRRGGVGREGHMVRPAAAKPPGQTPADAEHRPSGGEGVLMGSPAAVSVGGHGLRHRLRHAGGLGTGGGGVIQIDHGLITLDAPASFSTMAYILVAPPTASFSVRP